VQYSVGGTTTSGDQQTALSATRPWVHVSWLLIRVIVAAWDFALVVLSFVGADIAWHIFVRGDEVQVSDALVMSALAGALLTGTIALKDGYTLVRLGDLRFQRRVAFLGWVVGFFVVGWLAFLTKSTADFSRIGVTGGFLFGLVVLLTARQALLRYLAHLMAAGHLTLQSAYVVFAGTPTDRWQRLAQMAREGTMVTGASELDLESSDQQVRESAISGLVNEIRSALEVRYCDAVYLFLPWSQLSLLDEIKLQFVRLPVPVYLFADGSVDKILSGFGITISATPAFEIQRAPLSLLERSMKRGLDLTAATGLLLLLSPLLLMTAILIRLSSSGPVFFRQARRGFGGRKFEILKFRTMTAQSCEAPFVQATRNDARVTPLGSVLRRTSIDELPQLWNVLRGEMSLVGPRPHPLALDNRYDEPIANYAYRNHVKPGITGWAQVNGYRGETPDIAIMEARVMRDLWYISNWSLWLDIRILLRTVMVVPYDTKAY
jgi:Undecaprenyl-phosphate glucose phosphotransferase